MNRRGFISLLSVSGGALLFNNCKPPKEKIIPYNDPVEYIKPGKAVLYSSVFSLKNAAFGITVTTRDGRPVRIDGNDNHPSNRGSSSHFIQASIYDLYNPVRIRKPTINNKNVSLNQALDFLKEKIWSAISKKGTIRIVIDEHCSPSLRRLILEIEELIPGVKFITYPAIRSSESFINSQLFNLDGEIVPDIVKSNLIVAIDKDFLGTDKLSLYYQNQFSKKRSKDNKFRLISIEPYISLTSANSDEHYAINSDCYELLLSKILIKIILSNDSGKLEALLSECRNIEQIYNDSGIGNYEELDELSIRIADELLKNKGKSIFWVGGNLSRTVLALAGCINYFIGNLGDGKPFNPKNILPFSSDKANEIKYFTNELTDSCIDLLILTDTDLFYYADNSLRVALEKFPKEKIISLSLYPTKSTLSSVVDIPLNHYLESWGDAITHDGIYSVRQPVILQLNNDSISFEDFLFKVFIKEKTILGKILDKIESNKVGRNENITETQIGTYYDYLKSYWIELTGTDEGVVRLIKTGFFLKEQVEPDISFKQEQLISIVRNFEINNFKLDSNALRKDKRINRNNNDYQGNDNYEVKVKCAILPSHSMFDGTFSENKLLSELPDPITKISWQPVVIVSKRLASELKLVNGCVVRLRNSQNQLELPVLSLPIISDDTVFINYGYGKNNDKENAFRLIDTWDYSYKYFGINIESTNEKITLPILQSAGEFEDILNISDKKFYLSIVGKEKTAPYPSQKNDTDNDNSIYKKYKYAGHKWEMAIDLNLCTGCGACVIACQIENNIPVIGKKEILKGRQMHWLRINRYFETEKSSNVVNAKAKCSKVYFLPVLCQHCDNAPCESVCPVSASTHSPEGLNETTYNRCIGSRFCILNCPYDVRRFNYYDYSGQFKKPLNYGLNPNVTVRSRGVVEKCTFCIQRINEARYIANDDGYDKIPDGYIKTACQQACPSGAIMFGNKIEKNSKLSKAVDSERSFHLFESLNTKPSVVYLKKINNDIS